MRRSVLVLFKAILVVACCFGIVRQAQAQCAYGTPSLAQTVAAPTVVGATVTSVSLTDNQVLRVTGITTGGVYRVYNCGSGFDTQITIFPQGGGTNEGYNDDNGPECTGAAASINYAPTVTGTKDIKLQRYNCSTAGNVNGTVTIRLVTAPPAATCNYTVPGTGNNSITTCSGTICDPGGTGNYLDNQNGYTVINPTAGNLARITGVTSAGEACCDYVRVYDGTGTGGTLLGQYQMGTAIPQLTSSTGPLTVQFVSDVSITGAGFSATISCIVAPPVCNYTVPGTGNNSITTCSGTICDPGGTSDYVDNQNGYTVINPTAGNLARITGVTSAGEACCDYVRVYDGTGTGGTLLGQYQMGTAIPQLTSSTGPLTVQFVSDVSIVGAGFSATISCITAPPPPACVGSPTAPANGATGISIAGTTLSWPSAATATGYDVYFGTTNPAPTLVSSNQAGLTYATGALSGSTTYFWRIVPRNAFGAATGCTNWSFTTAAGPPANDLCANAISIASLPYTSAVINNALATDDSPTSSCDGPYKNVWWTVTGICGTMTAITCTGGTNFDDEIAVFTSTGGCSGPWTQVACNDDNGAGCTSNYAGVSWTGTAGALYYITVGSYFSSTATGNLQLNVTATPFTASVAPTGISGSTTICAGGSTTLTATGGTLGTGATIEWFTGSCGGTPAGTGASISVSPGTATTYYVRYNGTCNTTTCTSTVVSVTPLPTVSITPDPAVICAGGSITLTATGTPDNSLANVLSAINTNSASLQATIPTPFAFAMDGGVNGTNIIDGGLDMYDGGNSINTNLASTITYSDNTIVASASFGSGGQYFTRYIAGSGGTGSLFFWAADINGLSTMSITGNNGADGQGTQDTHSFTVSAGGITYTAFLKRVYNAFDPSINQLFLIPQPNSASQTIGVTTDDSQHNITGLTGVTRVYYMLYAGASGAFINNTQATTIAQNFVNIIPTSSYSWNPGGATTAAITVSPGSTTTYTVTYSSQGCSNTASREVTVNPLPIVSCGSYGPVCTDAADVTLGGSPTGGTWSGTGVTAGVFDPSVGTQTLTYTYTDGNSCTNSCMTTITVNPLPVMSCGSYGPACSNDPDIALGGSPAGGTWSGTGVMGNSFDPSVGTQTLTYTYTDGNGCTNSCMTTITVNTAPIVTCGGLYGPVCEDAADITLTGSPAGGTWSGTGVTGNNFDPSAGSQTLTYTYSDGTCSNSCMTTITVNPLPVVTCGSYGPVCVDAADIALSGSPAGGTWSGTGVTGSNFDPSVGTQTLTYSYTDGNGCTNSCMTTITVNPLPVVTCGSYGPLNCSDVITLGGSPTGGTWTGTGVSGTGPYSFSASAGTQLLTYTYTDGNGCTDMCTTTIAVPAMPTASGSVFLDCDAPGFYIAVNLTGLGGAFDVNLVPSTGSPINEVDAPGVYNLGPFTSGSSVSVTVENNSDPSCILGMGSFTGTLNCINNGDCIAGGVQNIPDNGCASSTHLDVHFPISGMQDDLNSNVILSSVDLQIEHTYRGDLQVRLISPTGQSRDLFLQKPSTSAGGNNLGDLSQACPNAPLTFQDGGAALSTLNSGTDNAAFGIFAPEQTLAGFTGNPNGTWTLSMCDNAGAEVGSLRHIKLNFQNMDCLGVIGGSTLPGSPCDDGNILTQNDTYDANCLCSGEFVDCLGTPNGTALPGTSCDDGFATTGNDIYQPDCTCSGELIDCMGVPGGSDLPGSPCDDNNAGTNNDMWDGSCNCAGTPFGCQDNEVALDLGTNGAGAETSWEIIPSGGGAALCSGSGYPDNTTTTETCCLANGCYRLLVYDSFGDGMAPGGYRLLDENGARIIDNWQDGTFTNTSAIANNGDFCLPLGTVAMQASSCDQLALMPTSVVSAVPDAAVTAEYGVGVNTDDGYQFWIYDPDGTYSRTIFKSHTNPGQPGQPYGSTAAAYLKLSSIVTMPVPTNVKLNIKVRSRVNGVNSNYGPACTMMIDVINQCPTTQLVNNTNSSQHSCGVLGKVVGASGTTGKIYCTTVPGANKYQWRFVNSTNSYVRTIGSATAVLPLNNWATNPLLCGTHTYDVSVRISFDNGANYCPYGTVCTVGITNNNATPLCTPPTGPFAGGLHMGEQDEVGMRLWPNPVREGNVTLEFTGVASDVTEMHIVVMDLFGKTVLDQQLRTDGAEQVKTTLTLGTDIASGLYVVNVTAGASTFTERLVVE